MESGLRKYSTVLLYSLDAGVPNCQIFWWGQAYLCHSIAKVNQNKTEKKPHQDQNYHTIKTKDNQNKTEKKTEDQNYHSIKTYNTRDHYQQPLPSSRTIT